MGEGRENLGATIAHAPALCKAPGRPGQGGRRRTGAAPARCQQSAGNSTGAARAPQSALSHHVGHAVLQADADEGRDARQAGDELAAHGLQGRGWEVGGQVLRQAAGQRAAGTCCSGGDSRLSCSRSWQRVMRGRFLQLLLAAGAQPNPPTALSASKPTCAAVACHTLSTTNQLAMMALMKVCKKSAGWGAVGWGDGVWLGMSGRGLAGRLFFKPGK